MATTLDGARLKQITVSGSKISASMAGTCVAASLSLSREQVTEMSMSFQDSYDLDVFTSGLLSKGATIRYGDWHLISDGVDLSANALGPVISVKAPSKFVTALRRQTGAKSWGTTPLSSWVASVAGSVGMKHLVQPGLGSKLITRKAPAKGETAESTFDVLTQQARETGVWLFEYGSTLVFAKPSYLVKATWPRRTWSLTFHHWHEYSDGLVGMPRYRDNNSDDLPEWMEFGLVSADADQARPGDAVVLTGRNVGKMGGTWIINAVNFPLNIAAPVTVTCQRPVDPVAEPPQSTATASTSGSSKAASSSSSNVPVTSGAASAFDRFMGKYNGVAIDQDGAFGAQCVDLTMRYASEVFGVRVNGNGNQWYANGAASGAFYQVGAGATPAKGDIACWGSFYGGGYGHVAIVIADQGGSLRVLTQNPGATHVTTLSKQGLQGYLRPKRAV